MEVCFCFIVGSGLFYFQIGFGCLLVFIVVCEYVGWFYSSLAYGGGGCDEVFRYNMGMENYFENGFELVESYVSADGNAWYILVRVPNGYYKAFEITRVKVGRRRQIRDLTRWENYCVPYMEGRGLLGVHTACEGKSWMLKMAVSYLRRKGWLDWFHEVGKELGGDWLRINGEGWRLEAFSRLRFLDRVETYVLVVGDRHGFVAETVTDCGGRIVENRILDWFESCVGVDLAKMQEVFSIREGINYGNCFDAGRYMALCSAFNHDVSRYGLNLTKSREADFRTIMKSLCLGRHGSLVRMNESVGGLVGGLEYCGYNVGRYGVVLVDDVGKMNLVDICDVEAL